jgi:FkbM family methyltransferase
MIIPELLNANSVVCSFGVGNDISFDRAMIQRFGANVHGFDPSPDAIRFVASQIDLPSRYHFHPYGLGSIDGDADFFRPAQGAMYSLKAAAEQNDASRVSLPVKRLATILDALDIGFIDVLKMDIEGAEYAQIDSIVENGESIGQLLIEFHHRIGSRAPQGNGELRQPSLERPASSCSMCQEPVRSSLSIADPYNRDGAQRATARASAFPTPDTAPPLHTLAPRPARSSPPRDARSPLRKSYAAASASAESSPPPRPQTSPADRW